MTDEKFDLVQHAKIAARDSINDLEKPEQDILPVLLTYGPRGMGVAGIEMPDDEGKDALARMMTATVAFSQAEAVVFISTAWMAPAGSSTVRPRDNPQRLEKVVLLHWSNAGDSMYTASVIRHENRPPDLGQWEEMGSAMGGRFGDAIQLGMKLAQSVDTVPGLLDLIEKGWDSGDPTEMMSTFVRVLEKMEGQL